MEAARETRVREATFSSTKVVVVPGSSSLRAAREVQAVTAGDRRELSVRIGEELVRHLGDVAVADIFVTSPTGELAAVRAGAEGQGLLVELERRLMAAPGGPRHLLPALMSPGLVLPEVGRRGGAILWSPLLGKRSFLGVLVAELAPERSLSPQEDLRLFNVVAELAAGILGLLSQREVLGGISGGAGWSERDMASARDVQRSFLPPLRLAFPGAKARASYLPSHPVGGDFFDVVDAGEGRLVALIGDVAGKGIPAALLMARVSADARRLAKARVEPAQILTELNAAATHFRDDSFVTVACMTIDVRQRRVRMANAGHLVPLRRGRDGTLRPLGFPSGPPIGMIPTHAYQQMEAEVFAGDILIFATDGVLDVFEGQRRPGATIGFSRFADFLTSLPHDLHALHDAVERTVAAATRSRDDVAVLGIEITG
jgi:hypothetical protein